MDNHVRMVLVLSLLGSVPAASQPLTIDHQGVGCAVAEKFPRLEARFAPAGSVAAARVVFQPEKSDQWWAVSMKPEGAGYFGILPKPKRTLAAFRYYIEVTDRAMATSRTPDYTAAVVSGSGECSGRLVAGQLGAASVLLEGPAGVATPPAGFASAGVVAAGSVAGAAAATATVAGAATGGGIGTGAIVAGVAAAAAGAAVAAKGGGGDSPSTPGSTSAPTPAPAPTPAAPTMAGHWVGLITLSGNTSCITDIIYDLTQVGSSFSGSGATSRRVAPGCSAQNGTLENVAGTLTGNSFNFSDRFVTGSQFCNESVTGLLSGNQASGTSTGTGQGTGACTTVGNFTITRQ